MNILITGSTSFLGLAITKRLLLDGHEVFAIIRPDSLNIGLLNQHPQLHIIKAYLYDSLEAFELPDMAICLHLAWAAPGLSGRMNAEMQYNNYLNKVSILKTASKLSVKTFIFFGSQCEYGINAERIASGEFKNEPVTEDTPCRPLSFYAKEKLHVLNDIAPIAISLGIKYIHLRFFSVYGPNEHSSSLISTCISSALSGNPANLSQCCQLWNYLYIDDCADIVSSLVMNDNENALFNSENSVVLNAASFDTRPLLKFTEEIFSICGGSGNYIKKPSGPEGTVWLNPSINKLCTLIKWKPQTSFRDGIKACYKAYYNNSLR